MDQTWKLLCSPPHQDFLLLPLCCEPDSPGPKAHAEAQQNQWYQDGARPFTTDAQGHLGASIAQRKSSARPGREKLVLGDLL